LITGLLGLLLSLLPLTEVCRYRTGQQLGWRLLFSLVIGFIVGYLAFLSYLIASFSLKETTPVIYLVIGSVFAGGGWFVFLVARMSRASLDKLQRVAEKYEQQSLKDVLTGLPNRKSLFLVLQHTIAAAGRQRDPFAVMVLDLNNFKEIIDTMGHAAGDHVLTVVSPRLNEQLRVSDTLCRMGGDEFAVILPRTSPQEAQLVANKLIDACKQPIVFAGQPIAIGVSIGIAVWPLHSDAGEELLQLADIAMYQAKRAGIGSAARMASAP